MSRVTGFLGPNGAGKSTTMRMILGLDAPTSNAGIQIIEKTTQPLQLSPWAGLAVFAGWVVLAFAAALVLLRRRDA